MDTVIQRAQVQLFTEAIRVKPPTPDQVEQYLADTRLAEVLDAAANDAVKRLVKDPFAHVAVHCLSESSQRGGHITAERVQDLATATQREEELHRKEADMAMEQAKMRKAEQVAIEERHRADLLDEKVKELTRQLRHSRTNSPAAAKTALEAAEARAEAAEARAANEEMRAQQAEKRATREETRALAAEAKLDAAEKRANDAEARAGKAAREAREAAMAAKNAQLIADEADAEAAAAKAEKEEAAARRLEEEARRAEADAKRAAEDSKGQTKTPPAAQAPAATPPPLVASGGRSRRISFEDDDTPRVHASQIFHFLTSAGPVSSGGQVDRAQLVEFAACLQVPIALASPNNNTTEAGRALAWMLLRMAESKKRYTQNEYLDAFENGPRPFGGGYKWAAQYAIAVRSLSNKLYDTAKAAKVKGEMLNKPKEPASLRAKHQESEADLLFSFLVDGSQGVVQRFRLRACAVTFEEGVVQAEHASTAERDGVRGFVVTLQQLADEKPEYSRKQFNEALKKHGAGSATSGTMIALKRAASILRDDGAAFGWQRSILKAMMEDTKALIYRFLDEPRKNGVDESSIVALAASLLKGVEAKGDLAERKACKAMVRVLAQMAQQSKKYNFEEWKAFAVPEKAFKDGEQQDYAILLMHSCLDSKSSAVGVRKQMEKERMDLRTLCDAVQL